MGNRRARKDLIRPVCIVAGALFSLSVVQQAKSAVFHTNSPLTTARYSHTATLLPNGKVLAAGGWNGSNLSSCELYDPATGRWTTTGPMTTNRCFHAATLLPNGKVLVTGGYANESPYYLATAEVYNPATGTWAPTAPMIVAHVFHTSTLLPNGKVLVVGGASPTGLTASAELYDPANGTWTPAGAMGNARWYHTATVLTNGRVLVAGGDYLDRATAEIYDSVLGTWTNAGAMTTNRVSHTATLLPNGRVLASGGSAADRVHGGLLSLSTAELFDPNTGTWTPTTNALATARANHTASLLPNGQLLVAGGFKDGPGAVSTAELYDPITGAWTVMTNSLNNKRWGHTATLLHNGQMVLAGGIGTDLTDSTEIYEYAKGQWVATEPMPVITAYPTATVLPDGDVLFISIRADLYNANTAQWTPIVPMQTPASSGHTATLLPSGKVLVAGGYRNNTYLARAELYDPPTRTWTNTSALKIPRYEHTATLLPHGRVLVAGGGNFRFPPTPLSSAELYDPATGAWTNTSPLATPRRGHTATLLSDGKVMVAGGYNGSRVSRVEIYDPVTGTWTATGDLNTARNAHTATLLPGGKVLVTGGYNGSALSSAELYDPASRSWRSIAAMRASHHYHTATLLPNGKVLVAGTRNLTNISELYDPATETWTVAGPLITAREFHAATLLPDGNVLIAGGTGNSDFLSSAELYDTGLGFGASSRPRISSVTSPLRLGDSLMLTGSGFRGISGGSGGNTQDSATDCPVVQLRSMESGQMLFLLSTNWSTNAFASTPVSGFAPGYALATVFVNGIPGTGSVVSISVPVPTPPTLTNAKRLTDGSFQFGFTNSPGALFGVLTTTNLTLPLTNWTVLGGVGEIAPGQFQFADSDATNNAHRFYQLRSP